VTSYALRRLLLMIPTFFGILLINFGILRLQGLSLTDALNAQMGAGMDGRKIQSATKNLETYLGRFRRTGNDRPALLNLRGFSSKESVLAWLKAVERSGHTVGRADARRNRRELELYFQGPLYVQPLREILADEALSEYHGIASVAFSLCAYVPLNSEDLRRLSPQEISTIQARNADLAHDRVEYTNTNEVGFLITDPEYAAKRSRLLGLYDANQEEFDQAGRRWTAILCDTGFTAIMGKLFTGDLYSETRQQYVYGLIADRWRTSFWLNLLSIVIAWGVSIPLGIRSARRLGTLEDRLTTNSLFFLWSLPTFFVGTLLLHHLCTSTGHGDALFPNRGLASPGSEWFPVWRYLADLAWHGFLPLAVLSYGSFTSLSRYMRGNLLEQMNADYIRTARAKGCDEDRVVYRHAVRNSMITMITLGAGLLSDLFGGFVIVENIFSINGLGTLLVDAARQSDAPLVMGSTVISVGLLLFGILVSDLLYGLVDPRIRNSYA
jgi:peptide/nickel transport system permease protein